MKMPKVSPVYKGEKLRKRSREEGLIEASHKKAMVMIESSNLNKYGNNNAAAAAAAGTVTMIKMSNVGKKPIDGTVAEVEEGRDKTGVKGEVLDSGGGTETAVMDINEEAAMVWDNWEVSDMEIREGYSTGLTETKDLGGFCNQELTWTTPEDKEITWDCDIWNFPTLSDFKQLPKP